MSIDIKKMFDEISPYYDKMNNLLSFFTHKYFKHCAISRLKIENNSKILDLCCGSGDIVQIIKKKYPKVNVIGLDFSQQMLENAKQKNPDVDFVQADVLDMPFCDNEFDIVIIGFGLRNIQDKKTAIKEIKRILKPNGQFLHLDFEGKNCNSFFYDKVALFLSRFFVKNIEPYEYLMDSKREYFSSDELVRFMSDFGFECLNCKKMFLNIVSFQVFRLIR